ncbi:MAG: hypothetical protein canaca05_00570 [Anaerolineaceae bacterium]|jgi:hypothetical protein
MKPQLFVTNAKKTLSLLLIFAFLVITLPSCNRSEPQPTTTQKTEASVPDENAIVGTLSNNIFEVSDNGVGIEISPVCLNNPAEVTITPRNDLPPLEEISITGYDFDIDTDEELAGVMWITLPYDKSQLDPNVDVSRQVGAAYFNESTQEWESVDFRIDEVHSNVIITTDHLSIFGAFVVGKEYTRAAYVQYTIPSIAMRAATLSSQYEDIIREAIEQNMTPGPSALVLGNAIVTDWLNITGAGLNMSSVVYASDFIENISNLMTNLGLLSAIAQAAVDYQSGNNTALYVNLIKNLTNFSVSKFGTSMMNLASVGVFCIDYSITQFANEALSGRKDIYDQAYRLYYEREAKRTAKDWYLILMPMAKAAKSPDELNQKVMAEIDRYTKQFWEDETVVAYYQDEAMKYGFTGGGGLNQAIMDELSRNHKIELLQGLLQPVFGQISRKLAAEQQTELRKVLDELAKQLNTLVTIQVFDSAYDQAEPKPLKSSYAGYIARIAPLAEEVKDKEKWQQVIDNEGKASLPFRILGHLMAGSPNKIEIVSPDEPDNVLKTIEFIVTPPTVQVDIGEQKATGMVFAKGTLNSPESAGIFAALEELGVIPIEEDGHFSVSVPYVATTRQEGTLLWNIETTDFTMEGTWDNRSKTGNVEIGAFISANGVAKEAFSDDPNMEKHYAVWEYDYSYIMNGSGNLSLEGSQIIMQVNFDYSRTGNYTQGITVWFNDHWEPSDNPVIVDQSGDFTASWVYYFNIQ